MTDKERIEKLERQIRELQQEVALIKKWGTTVIGTDLQGKPLVPRVRTSRSYQ